MQGPTLSPAVTSSIRIAKATQSSRDCQSLLFISFGGKVFLTDRAFPLEMKTALTTGGVQCQGTMQQLPDKELSFIFNARRNKNV